MLTQVLLCFADICDLGSSPYSTTSGLHILRAECSLFHEEEYPFYNINSYSPVECNEKMAPRKERQEKLSIAHGTNLSLWEPLWLHHEYDQMDFWDQLNIHLPVLHDRLRRHSFQSSLPMGQGKTPTCWLPIVVSFRILFNSRKKFIMLFAQCEEILPNKKRQKKANVKALYSLFILPLLKLRQL